MIIGELDGRPHKEEREGVRKKKQLHQPVQQKTLSQGNKIDSDRARHTKSLASLPYVRTGTRTHSHTHPHTIPTTHPTHQIWN